MKYVHIDNLTVGDFAVCFDEDGNPFAGVIEKHPFKNGRAANHLFSAKFGRWIIPNNYLVIQIYPTESPNHDQ